jgi:hypothetical protein
MIGIDRINRLRIAALLAAAFMAAGTQAKLPAPTDDQKARATEAAARAAENAKKEAALLGAAQDRVVQKYAEQLKAQGRPFNPTIAPAPAGATPGQAGVGAQPAGTTVGPATGTAPAGAPPAGAAPAAPRS